MTPRESIRMPAATAPRGSLVWGLATLVVAWFLLILVAGSHGVFVSGPSRPPLPLLIAVVGPPALFAVAYRVSRRFRDLALGIDLRLLTAMQTWRVLGGVFLFLYAFALLPGLFAWPAGLGDMGVGVAAVFVLYAMMTGARSWRRSVWWLNVMGLVDFVVAVGTGVLTSNTALGSFASGTARADMGALPLSLIPTFAVPMWIIFHVISLLQLRSGVAARNAVARAEAA
jgi:hypothetical protein